MFRRQTAQKSSLKKAPLCLYTGIKQHHEQNMVKKPLHKLAKLVTLSALALAPLFHTGQSQAQAQNLYGNGRIFTKNEGWNDAYNSQATLTRVASPDSTYTFIDTAPGIILYDNVYIDFANSKPTPAQSSAPDKPTVISAGQDHNIIFESKQAPSQQGLIYNMQGQVITQVPIQWDGETASAYYNPKSLPGGTYVFSTTTPQGRVSTKLLQTNSNRRIGKQTIDDKFSVQTPHTKSTQEQMTAQTQYDITISAPRFWDKDTTVTLQEGNNSDMIVHLDSLPQHVDFPVFVGDNSSLQPLDSVVVKLLRASDSTVVAQDTTNSLGTVVFENLPYENAIPVNYATSPEYLLNYGGKDGYFSMNYCELDPTRIPNYVEQPSDTLNADTLPLTLPLKEGLTYHDGVNTDSTTSVTAYEYIEMTRGQVCIPLFKDTVTIYNNTSWDSIQQANFDQDFQNALQGYLGARNPFVYTTDQASADWVMNAGAPTTWYDIIMVNEWSSIIGGEVDMIPGQSSVNKELGRMLGAEDVGSRQSGLNSFAGNIITPKDARIFTINYYHWTNLTQGNDTYKYNFHLSSDLDLPPGQ